jgi:tetratricopeptide (TPR) repeat protein
LPDLSNVAPSVRVQIQGAYSTLMERTQRPESSAGELAIAYGEMGKLLLAAEFGQAAESCLVNAQVMAPTDMRWPYYLGHVYKAQGDTAKSTASFEQALQLSPNDITTLVWLGETHLTEDRLDSAGSMFAKALALQPAEGAAMVGLGRVALAKRDHAAAVRHLEAALVRGQTGDALHYSLALAYRGLGDVAKAEAHMAQRGKGQMVVRDPLMDDVRRMLQSTSSYEARGIQALEEGNAKAAAESFRKGIALAPNDASLHHRLGTALYLAGDAEAGREEFETALQLAPDLARAHYSLGVLLASSGQPQQAIVRLAAAVRHEPTYVEARLLLGDIFRHTGRTQEALEQYGEVIKIDPRVTAALLGRALALADSRDYTKALERLVSATNTHPDNPDLIQALARLRAAAPDSSVRDGAHAVALMKGLMAREPSRGPDMSEAMAMAYAETGDYQQATAWQRRAIAAAERDASMQREMGENLELFERGEPSRTPWADYAKP